MSGGHFNYNQRILEEIAEEINYLIKNNKLADDYGYCYNYSDEIIKEFKKAVKLLKEANIYVQRIDWLVSGDDSEDSFYKRLKDELI